MEGLGLSCYASLVDETGESCEATSSSKSLSSLSRDGSSIVYRPEETPTSDDIVATCKKEKHCCKKVRPSIVTRKQGMQKSKVCF